MVVVGMGKMVVEKEREGVLNRAISKPVREAAKIGLLFFFFFWNQPVGLCNKSY